MNLLDQIREAFQPAVAAAAIDAEKVSDYLTMVKATGDAKHGDYQANFAMAMAKASGRKPQEVAHAIIAALPASELFETPEVAGPGFINVRLKSPALAEQLRAMATDERLGVPSAATPKTFVIDYSGPNVAKPLHVGHLRSTIIGEALARLLRFLGHTVVGDNHLGDWGTQFGILLYGYKNFRDDAAYAADPVRELARLYVHVRSLFVKKSDDDEDAAPANDPVAQACRAETAKLHDGDPENRALWAMFMPHCLEEIHTIYRRLDIHFDTQHGESFYQPMLASVVEELLAKGLAFESRGAVVIPNAKGVIPTEADRKKEDPPALIRKTDGAFTYTTTDLATVKYRSDTYSPDVILYVVDPRQELHFKTVFAAGQRWGFAAEFHHLKFGSVLQEVPEIDPTTGEQKVDKKGAPVFRREPISTRKGGAVELETLLDEAVRMGLSKYEATREERIGLGFKVPDLTAEQRKEIADVVGIAAVKYADLCQNRESDYLFDYDKMLATEGNTATYMQYVYVRCRGIVREGDIDDARFRTAPPSVTLDSPFERALAMELLRFSEALDRAATDYMPHWLTGYLWDLSKAFNRFYEELKVLKAETPALRDSRLLLCDLTARVIQKTLHLLGIRTVEVM